MLTCLIHLKINCPILMDLLLTVSLLTVSYPWDQISGELCPSSVEQEDGLPHDFCRKMDGGRWEYNTCVVVWCEGLKISYWGILLGQGCMTWICVKEEVFSYISPFCHVYEILEFLHILQRASRS